MTHDLAVREGHADFEHHEGLHRLPEHLVVHADDRRIAHALQVVEYILYFFWRDFFPAGLDDVVHTTHEVQIPFVV